MTALDELVFGPRHVVTQVVEAELVVGAIGDVLGVFQAASGRLHRRKDASRLKAEGTVDPAHQLRLVGGQVVIDSDDVDALALQRVQV